MSSPVAGVLRTWIYSLTLLVSASLIFSIQPMLSKMVLPVLGGAPLVWNTMIVFFQGALLAGYLYAYLSARFLPLSAQAIGHVVLLAAAIYFLPAAVTQAWGEPPSGAPQWWLLLALVKFVAMPFIVLSGTATILQNWFAHSDSRSARDPYFLYVASNTGSLLALLSYPVVVERFLPLHAQSQVWMLIYGLLLALTVVCALSLGRRTLMQGMVAAGVPAARTPGPAWPTRLRWMALAFVPSMLLLGVTLHLTTDVISVPFLWVVPLAIYLLTFIMTFAKRQLVPAPTALLLQLLVCMALATYLEAGNFALALLFHLAALLCAGLVCHGALARERPDAAHLPEFYLWMAAGGWLGGLAAGLLAPVLFDSVLEYPLALGLACLARARTRDELRPGGREIAIALAVLGLYFGLRFDREVTHLALLANPWAWRLVDVATIAGIWFCRRAPLALAVIVASLVAAQTFKLSDETLLAERTFYGVHRVRLEQDGRFHVLYHGTTLHGAQSTVLGAATLPLLYYYPRGPAGQIAAARSRTTGLGDVGIIGLGAGSLACLFRDARSITYFELDPTVVRIATTPDYFSFLQDCKPDAHIETGDGRLLLTRQPDAAFNMLVVDAFSSDTIPVHLLTQEAVRLYLSKLRPGGLLLFHISNRHLDLSRVLAPLAAAEGLTALIQDYAPGPQDGAGATASEWVVMARSPAELAFLGSDNRWRPMLPGSGDTFWTDDYSHLGGVLVFSTRTIEGEEIH